MGLDDSAAVGHARQLGVLAQQAEGGLCAVDDDGVLQRGPQCGCESRVRGADDVDAAADARDVGNVDRVVGRIGSDDGVDVGAVFDRIEQGQARRVGSGEQRLGEGGRELRPRPFRSRLRCR